MLCLLAARAVYVSKSLLGDTVKNRNVLHHVVKICVHSLHKIYQLNAYTGGLVLPLVNVFHLQNY